MAKRALDLLLSTAAIVLLSPVFILVGALIFIAMGPPVFFHQMRPGLKARPFKLYKFRTMKNAYDASGKPLPDTERLSGIGKILRSLSLDELPEIWNVIKGDMSLVGPRPLLMQYLGRYTPEQSRRHDVKPGITGWAQINGRNAITWEEKFKLDLWYVDNGSFWVDIKILLITVLKVLRREGISYSGQATMEEFKGEDKI